MEKPRWVTESARISDERLKLLRELAEKRKPKFIVEGGVFTDTDWKTLVEGTEEHYGPFNTRAEAIAVWRGKMGWMIDTCTHRLFVKEVVNQNDK